MPAIAEEDALEVMNLMDSLPGEARAKATEFLARYRHQQEHERGEPMFPTLVRREREQTEQFRSMFDDLKNVDKVAPAIRDMTPLAKDADALRARTANTMFLSRRSGRSQEEVIHNYPLFMRD